jgi:hypothetical protein
MDYQVSAKKGVTNVTLVIQGKIVKLIPEKSIIVDGDTAQRLMRANKYLHFIPIEPVSIPEKPKRKERVSVDSSDPLVDIVDNLKQPEMLYVPSDDARK